MDKASTAGLKKIHTVLNYLQERAHYLCEEEPERFFQTLLAINQGRAAVVPAKYLFFSFLFFF
jgi:hypothetical protein